MEQLFGFGTNLAVDRFCNFKSLTLEMKCMKTVLFAVMLISSTLALASQASSQYVLDCSKSYETVDGKFVSLNYSAPIVNGAFIDKNSKELKSQKNQESDPVVLNVGVIGSSIAIIQLEKGTQHANAICASRKCDSLALELYIDSFKFKANCNIDKTSN